MAYMWYMYMSIQLVYKGLLYLYIVVIFPNESMERQIGVMYTEKVNLSPDSSM